MTQTADQWKDIGNCKICRRNGYCRKQCSANKRLCRELIRKLRLQKQMAREMAKAEKPEGKADG